MNVDAWVCEKNSTERKLLVKYARMFNRLDVNEFIPFLGDFVTYESQSVFDMMRGKPDVTDYFYGKIDAIKCSANTSLVRADVGEIPGFGDCTLLYQAKSDADRSMLDAPLGAMKIEVDGVGNAAKMLMITVAPSPSSAKGKCLFPGLDGFPMQPKRKPLLHLIEDYGQMKIELWLLNGNNHADIQAQSVVNEVIQSFSGAGYREYSVDDLCAEDILRLQDTGLQGFPGIVAYWKDKLIFRINGCPEAIQLLAKLRNEIY